MNQIIKKRRLSPLETSIAGNVIYILLVLVFKNVFDVMGGVPLITRLAPFN